MLWIYRQLAIIAVLLCAALCLATHGHHNTVVFDPGSGNLYLQESLSHYPTTAKKNLTLAETVVQSKHSIATALGFKNEEPDLVLTRDYSFHVKVDDTFTIKLPPSASAGKKVSIKIVRVPPYSDADARTEERDMAPGASFGFLVENSDAYTAHISVDGNEQMVLAIKPYYGAQAFKLETGIGVALDSIADYEYAKRPKSSGDTTQVIAVTNKPGFSTRAILYTGVNLGEDVDYFALRYTPIAILRVFGFDTVNLRTGVVLGTDLASNNSVGHSILIGGILQLGESQQLSLTLGLNFGSATRVKGYSVGDPFTGNDADIPTQQARLVRPYLGIAIKI